MYKLASIHRSSRSLQSFTEIYKKVSRHRSHQISRAIFQDAKKEQDLDNIDENIEHMRTNKKECKKIFPTLLVKRGKNWHDPEKNAFTAATAKRAFYTSSIKNGSSDQWSIKRIKLGKAEELYRSAMTQCMKIRENRQKTLKACGVVKWNPAAVPLNVEYEARVIADQKRDAAKIVPSPPKLHIINNIIANKSSEKSSVKSNNNTETISPRNTPALKIETLLKKQSVPYSLDIPTKKSKYASTKKFKIVYPTHSVKYRLNRTKPYAIANTSQQKLEPENKSEQEYKVKRDHNTVEFVPKNQKMHAIGKITSSEKVSFLLENPVEKENKPLEECVSGLIKSHPIVKTPSKVARMSIRKKYNVILLKNRARINVKIQEPPDDIEGIFTIDTEFGNSLLFFSAVYALQIYIQGGAKNMTRSVYRKGKKI